MLKLYLVLILAFQFELFIPQVSNANIRFMVRPQNYDLMQKAIEIQSDPVDEQP